MKKLKNINWEDGASEVIAWMFVIPFQIIMFCYVISITEVSILTQEVNYTNYVALRGACVAGSREAAENYTNETISANLPVGKFGVASIAEKVQTDEGEVPRLRLTHGDNNGRWVKGTLVSLDIVVTTNLTMLGTPKEIHSSMTMMLESPAGGSTAY